MEVHPFQRPLGRRAAGAAPGDPGDGPPLRRRKAAVGDDLEICLDLHTRLDPMDAIPLCRELERFNPYFLEDPIRSENPASFHQIRRHIHSPIAAGEQFATKWEFRELIEAELINYARIDLCIVGGLTEARKIAGWCETHYINIAPHNPLGPVST